MNVNTGEIKQITDEQLAKMTKVERAAHVPLPDAWHEQYLVEMASGMNRQQRRSYQRLLKHVFA
jgi:hypothetical protein